MLLTSRCVLQAWPLASVVDPRVQVCVSAWTSHRCPRLTQSGMVAPSLSAALPALLSQLVAPPITHSTLKLETKEPSLDPFLSFLSNLLTKVITKFFSRNHSDSTLLPHLTIHVDLIQQISTMVLSVLPASKLGPNKVILQINQSQR